MAKEADNRYRKTLSKSRTGVNITEKEIKHLDGIVSPLLLKGQSIRHIFNNHSDEIIISDKTLYSYVNNSLFTARNIDMPRTVRMSPRKNKSKTLKVDKDCRKGRTYKDFVKYINEHPESIICEGDSVEGKKVVRYSLHYSSYSRTYSLLFLETTMIPGLLHIYLKSSTLSLGRTLSEKYSMYCSLITEVSSQILKHLNTICREIEG